MSKKLAITFIVAAFIAGAIGGAWMMRSFFERFVTRLVSSGQLAQISNNVSVLNCIRKNDFTNAVELLETDLDGSLIVFGSFIDDPAKIQIEPQDLKVLQMFQNYRNNFPRTNRDLNISQMISNALKLGDSPTNNLK